MSRPQRRHAPLVLCACLLATTATSNAAQPAPAAPIPDGYRLVYAQNFDDPNALNSFLFSDPAAWQITTLDDNPCLDQARMSTYKPPHRSPLNIGLIANLLLADFVLEADLMQTSRDYGHRDMCLFFGFTHPAKFYYAHLSTQTDNHAHNIFIVNDQPRTKISTSTTSGVDWGRDVWRKVRLERRASDGTIRVFYDDMNTPIMTATDTTFTWGRVGFGSFDDTGRIDNIRIWAPQARPIPNPASPFPSD